MIRPNKTLFFSKRSFLESIASIYSKTPPASISGTLLGIFGFKTYLDELDIAKRNLDLEEFRERNRHEEEMFRIHQQNQPQVTSSQNDKKSFFSFFD